MRDNEPEQATSGLRWGWLAGIAVAVVGFGIVAGAALLTPGDPLSCRLPNPGVWFRCVWTRRFVVNATLVAAGVVAATIGLAMPVAIVRAAIRAARNRS